jgi:hypothetical protein
MCINAATYGCVNDFGYIIVYNPIPGLCVLMLLTVIGHVYIHVHCTEGKIPLRAGYYMLSTN